MNNNGCPAPDVLAGFASGDLDPLTLASLQAHVSDCDACLEMVGHLTSQAQRFESAELLHPSLAEAGRQIGPYRLLRRVGEGGMGEVWEAQQTVPVRRIVALKLLKAGMDTRQIVARFDAERQMLALMQHPGIAQVFDAGITDAGRPYFVMEYVEGVRITAYCDEHKLDLRERLRLFQRVCEAVQHAHQKGVIHRDLKPSNVLVTTLGGVAQPKVIDFGLAKATTPDLKDASLTELGTVLGTPAYASPEQMSLSAIDIDTRTDVYSLGALLYELLVGVIPFEADSEAPGALLELRHAIREREPTRPSARISRLGERVSTIAQARGLEARSLRRQLRGELDWIVMKALEKERERRYASPHELGLDIERYLNHEPLQAGPPTAAYRTAKFVRRHRIGTAFAATLALLMIAFVAVTIVQAQRIAEERDRATAEAAKANSINAFLQETLGAADPWQTGKDISIREVLANAAKKADAEFKDQPLVAAAVKNTIGKTYVGLGQFDEGERLIRAALAAQDMHAGPESAEVANSLYDLAVVQRYRSAYAESVEAVQVSLSLSRKLFGDSSAQVAERLQLLAVNQVLLARFDEAEKAAREAISISTRMHGEQSLETAGALLTLSMVLSDGRQDSQEGLRLARLAHDIHLRTVGANDLRTANAANALGASYWRVRQFDQAYAYYSNALAVHEAIGGRDSPMTATVRENAANALARLKRFDQSVPMLEEVLAIRRAKLGETAPVVARTMGNIAGHELDAGRPERAQEWLDRAMPLYAKAYGKDHPDYAGVLRLYGDVMRRQGKLAEAETSLRRALAIRAGVLGERHTSTADVEHSLGRVLVDLARYEEAERMLVHAYGVYMTEIGAAHAHTTAAYDSLHLLYKQWGRPERAAALERKREEDSRMAGSVQ